MGRGTAGSGTVLVVDDDEAFRTFASEHHVRAFFQDFSCEANGIFQALQTGSRAGAKRGSIHHYGVALHFAVGIEMRAEAGVKNRIVLEHNHGSFDGFEGGAARSENAPSSTKSVAAAFVTGSNGFIRNIPGTTMDNQ